MLRPVEARSRRRHSNRSAFSETCRNGSEKDAPSLQFRVSFRCDHGPDQGGESMSQEIINTMRNLREDMRQRLLLVPEYRALVALDRSIDEICAIMQEPATPQPAAHTTPAEPAAALEPAPVEYLPQPAAPVRQSAIANAFAETLAAKMRPTAPFQLAARVAG
jgi:hypothetical protein